MMRLHSVLEPSVLHASDQEWSDPAYRLGFERRLMELLDTVRSAKDAGCDYQVLFSDMLDLLIWDADTGTAWARSRDYMGSQLQGLVYRQLLPLARRVEPSESSLHVDPPLDERPADDLWLQEALELLTWAASQSEEFVIDVGSGGNLGGEASLLREGELVRVVPLCHNYREAVGTLPLDALARSSTPETLPVLVSLWTMRYLDANPGRSVVYRLEYSDGFMSLFGATPRQLKPDVVQAIARRVTQTQKSAQADRRLKDEPLRGQNLRRLRVNNSSGWRIHYSYIDEAGMRLEAVGPHHIGGVD